jgi:REP element-mobilizing transposase RayT
MTDYRRNFVAGGSFFFTVNLAERHRQLLTENIDELRAVLARREDGFRCAIPILRWRFKQKRRPGLGGVLIPDV